MSSLLRSRALLAATALLGLAFLGDDCSNDIVQDPTFRDWCGTSLCSWKTDYGQVTRVPTWSEEDLGVSFADNAAGNPAGTQISQVTEEDQASCILFTSVGNIAPQANLVVQVDFDNDGTIDATSPLGTATWTQVQTEITAPTGYYGATFYVTKLGTGTAVLAEIRVQSTAGCTAPVARTGTFILGDVCGTDADCASGLVCAPNGVCSQCDDAVACAGAVACMPRSTPFPFQCGPGAHLGVAGAPCLADSDCMSNACAGAKAEPFDSDSGTCDLNALGVDGGACPGFTALGGHCQ